MALIMAILPVRKGDGASLWLAWQPLALRLVSLPMLNGRDWLESVIIIGPWPIVRARSFFGVGVDFG